MNVISNPGGEALPADKETRPVRLDLSVVIPALNEGPNLALLLPEIRSVLAALNIGWEILIVTRNPDQQTREAADAAGALVIEQKERGYGGALLAAFATARGGYILTMDADLSHKPGFIGDLWGRREAAEILIASRYVEGGRAIMPRGRYALSRVLNMFFGLGLSLPIRDLSSGFRLYKTDVVRQQPLDARDFNIQLEILVRGYAEGWRTREIPFEYLPRRHGSSNARVVRFGLSYLPHLHHAVEAAQLHPLRGL